MLLLGVGCLNLNGARGRVSGRCFYSICLGTCGRCVGGVKSSRVLEGAARAHQRRRLCHSSLISSLTRAGAFACVRCSRLYQKTQAAAHSLYPSSADPRASHSARLRTRFIPSFRPAAMSREDKDDAAWSKPPTPLAGQSFSSSSSGSPPPPPATRGAQLDV